MSNALLEAPQTLAPNHAATSPAQFAVIEIATAETAPAIDKPCKRLISAREYQWMAENGLFGSQRVELINGEIINMPPISEAHAQSVSKVTTKTTIALHEHFVIRCQSPFNAGENGRPEPDIAIVRPDSLSADQPPSTAILLVEISKATLEYDRSTKASLYASLGIADYWIVNLVENQVEVCRQPIARASAEFGHDYAIRQIFQRGQSIALLEVPAVSIEVDAMLP